MRFLPRKMEMGGMASSMEPLNPSQRIELDGGEKFHKAVASEMSICNRSLNQDPFDNAG